MLNENLWNTLQGSLSPKGRKFSSNSNTFKRSPRNLEQVQNDERMDKFQRELKNLLRSKRESSERHSARKLERLIVQYKSNQSIDDDLKEQVGIIENEDPTLFDELSMKKKWTNVAKDPAKGVRDQNLDTSSYWQMLNHLPPKGVDRIVTDRILGYDKQSCDRILQSILIEKKMEDMRRQKIQRTRHEVRQKLCDRHN